MKIRTQEERDAIKRIKEMFPGARLIREAEVQELDEYIEKLKQEGVDCDV